MSQLIRPFRKGAKISTNCHRGNVEKCKSFPRTSLMNALLPAAVTVGGLQKHLLSILQPTSINVNQQQLNLLKQTPQQQGSVKAVL